MRDHRPRVVFDCMIFRQADARRLSPAAACLALAEHRLIDLYVSPIILTEIKAVRSRPQIRAKFVQLTDEVVEEFVARIESIANCIDEVCASIVFPRDPKDEPYLSLAAHANAHYLVSRDRDLLEGTADLTGLPPNLRILDPVSFLTAIREVVVVNQSPQQ